MSATRSDGSPRTTARRRQSGAGPGGERSSDSGAVPSSAAPGVDATSGSAAAWRGVPAVARSGRCHVPFSSCHQPGGIGAIAGGVDGGAGSACGSAAAWRGVPAVASSGRCHVPLSPCHQPGGTEGFEADPPCPEFSALCAGRFAGVSEDTSSGSSGAYQLSSEASDQPGPSEVSRMSRLPAEWTFGLKRPVYPYLMDITHNPGIPTAPAVVMTPAART
jgi:hypothetical protein